MLIEIKVRKAIKGDKDAFLDLIESQKEKLYKIAYTYVKNEQDALDIIQETICKAYVSLETLKKPRYFNTWLIKILMNVALTTVNKNKKVVPYEYENQTSNTLLDLKEINNMPIDFKISKYGDIKIDRFEITDDRIKYSYTKDGIIPYLSDLVFCDENGEALFFENSFSKKSVDRDNNRVDVIINLETNKDKSIAKKIKKLHYTAIMD